ncbi:hypothetical protein Q1695_011099 [Nippostrongylus brasiliensis]|nr:hypothetical protein Q1695_011099 [Nippostrongylus brasiliensis]
MGRLTSTTTDSVNASAAAPRLGQNVERHPSNPASFRRESFPGNFIRTDSSPRDTAILRPYDGTKPCCPLRRIPSDDDDINVTLKLDSATRSVGRRMCAEIRSFSRPLAEQLEITKAVSERMRFLRRIAPKPFRSCAEAEAARTDCSRESGEAASPDLDSWTFFKQVKEELQIKAD